MTFTSLPPLKYSNAGNCRFKILYTAQGKVSSFIILPGLPLVDGEHLPHVELVGVAGFEEDTEFRGQKDRGVVVNLETHHFPKMSLNIFFKKKFSNIYLHPVKPERLAGEADVRLASLEHSDHAGEGTVALQAGFSRKTF